MNKTLLTFSVFMLGTTAIMLPVYADNSMAGMDMGSKKAAQKPDAATAMDLLVTATLNPAAPQTGDNTLDLLVTGPDGKPVTGLNLTTSVAMTSMDMGTTHPVFTETGGGHYTAKVSFGMDGPWRVVVGKQGGKLAVLDFNVGSKTPWKPPQMTSPGKPVSPAASTMPGMDMSDTAAKPTDKAADSGLVMAGMDMGDAKKTKDMPMTGIADMKTATVPELKETGTYTATGNENWKMQTGFGHNAPMVAMMNKMMVGGSGMEGMKMAPMDMKFGASNYTNPGPGDADDSMAGMDMGGKSGDTAKSDNMAGMKMDAPKAGDTPASAPAAITATMASAPKAGDNSLLITVTDPQGKPVTGAALSTSVAMTSMDMGTTHPAVTEKGAGEYTSTVNFSMAGPWRVQVKVTQPGQKPQITSFDFGAK